MLLLMWVPLASAGDEVERYSDFADATGFHTQKKMARDAAGSLWYTYVVPSGVGNDTEADRPRSAFSSPLPAGNDTDLGGLRSAFSSPLPAGNDTDVVVVHDGVELPRVRGARGNLARPSLALDASGDLHLSWTERADEDREVFAARYHDGAWDGIIQLSSGEGYAGFPSLAAGADGHVHVAWYGFDGTFYQTYYREWDGAWLPATQLSSGPLDANNPSLVVGPDGAVHVAWYKDEGRRYSVWHARRAPLGTWDLSTRIPGTVGDALNVALAFDVKGVLHAVWDERAAEGATVMHASWTDGRWQTAMPLASGADAGEYPAIAARGDGVFVAWSAQDGSLRGTDARGPVVAILDDAKGRHPSLRGPSVADASAVLDIMWAQPEDGGFEIRFAALGPGCPTSGLACASAGDVPAPIPAPPVVSILAAVACLALRRRFPGHRD